MCIYLHTFDILPQPMAEVEILQTKFIPQPLLFFVGSYVLFIKSCCESLSCICTEFAIHYLIEQENL